MTGGRKRKATGPDRPSYLDHGDVDRVMAVLLALTSEVAAIRERLDTHERLTSSQAPAAVEGYEPSAAVEAEREAWRDAYIRRLFRVIIEDVEGLGDVGGAGKESRPPVEADASD